MQITLQELDHLRPVRWVLYYYPHFIGNKMEMPQRSYTATRYRSPNWNSDCLTQNPILFSTTYAACYRNTSIYNKSHFAFAYIVHNI